MADAIGPEKTHEELRKLYELDPERSLLRNVIRRLADPIKSQDAKCRFRPHPLLVWLLGIGLVMATVFVYFSFSRP